MWNQWKCLINKFPFTSPLWDRRQEINTFKLVIKTSNLMLEICLRVFDFPPFLEPVLTSFVKSDGLVEELLVTVLATIPLNKHFRLSSIILNLFAIISASKMVHSIQGRSLVVHLISSVLYTYSKAKQINPGWKWLKLLMTGLKLESSHARTNCALFIVVFKSKYWPARKLKHLRRDRRSSFRSICN